MSIESLMLSNHVILCCPLLLLPLIFPSIRVFPNEMVFASNGLTIGASASSSVPLKNIQHWFPLGLTDLISLQSKGLSRVFSSTIIQNDQFFRAQPSLWSNFCIYTWLLEKPKLWLCGSLSAKQCLHFSVHCLGLFGTLRKCHFQRTSVSHKANCDSNGSKQGQDHNHVWIQTKIVKLSKPQKSKYPPILADRNDYNLASV